MVEESESETHECGKRGIAAVNTLGVRDSQQGTILHQAFILVGTGSTEKKHSNNFEITSNLVVVNDSHAL